MSRKTPISPSLPPKQLTLLEVVEIFKGLGANTSSILSCTKHPPAPTALTTYSPSDNPVRDAEVPVILLTEATRLPKRSYNSASQAT